MPKAVPATKFQAMLKAHGFRLLRISGTTRVYKHAKKDVVVAFPVKNNSVPARHVAAARLTILANRIRNSVVTEPVPVGR